MREKQDSHRYFITVARQYVYKNYGYKFRINVKYRIFKGYTKNRAIVEVTRKDGESFYLTILPLQDKVLHGGAYQLNKGINLISNLNIK